MDYKVEILLKSDDKEIRKGGVVHFARVLYDRFFLSKGSSKVYTFSIEPIDRGEAKYKFISDMDK